MWQVADVKKKIEASQQFPAANQKLIYSGALFHPHTWQTDV
jgi:hypothetical protein